MVGIDGGGLYFESTLDNDSLNAAVEETMRRIQGLTNATVSGGQAMDDAFQQAANDITKAFQDIDKMTDMHTSELRKLQTEYDRLGDLAAKAFMKKTSKGNEEYRALTEKQNAIKGEISVREQLIKEIGEQSNALVDAENKLNAHKQKVEENNNAQVSMRTRIKELREEMMLLIDQGIDEQSAAYQRLKVELGRLTDIQMDVSQQARTLANDEAFFQGMISGLSGVAGGFSAATGAISLFAGENENLQKIMLKVQSLMAITIGLQQIGQMLNKDSAFQLVTMTGLKSWWANAVAKAAKSEVVETATTIANTTAKKAQTDVITQVATAKTAEAAATVVQTTTATAGTVANLGLAGSFRAVGIAIKTIPVFGWIIAGLSAIIGLYAHFSSKAREAKKAQEEFNKSLVDGCYKPIASIKQLSITWTKLGNDIKAKEKFIEDNKSKFDSLGVAVNSVADAEKLLIDNRQSFIQAQMMKAKALAATELAAEKYKAGLKIMMETETPQKYIGTGNLSGQKLDTGSLIQHFGRKKTPEDLLKDGKIKINPEWEKYTESIKKEIGEANKILEMAADFSIEEQQILSELGLSTNRIVDGSINALEKSIGDLRAKYKDAATNKEREELLVQIKKQEALLENITGKKDGGDAKDPFLEKLEKQKKEYQRFMKMMNSGDESLIKAANAEFDGLLKQGATYIDYLKNQKQQILSIEDGKRTKEQNDQLKTLNDQIAEETKKTVLESFNNELSEQLNNAKSIMEMLNIIEQQRKQLSGDGTEFDNSKKEILDNAEKIVNKQAKEETDSLLENYSSYLQQKVKMEMQYLDDIDLLKKRHAAATTDAERDEIDRVIANRTKKYNNDKKGSGDADYDVMVKDYANFEQKKQAIIDDFDEKRRKAAEHGNQKLISELNKAQVQALSKLATETITNSNLWEKLFADADSMTLKQIDSLIQQINTQTLDMDVQFTDEDARRLNKELARLRNEVASKNPFTALYLALGKFNKEASSANLENLLNAGSDLAGNFTMISDSMHKIADEIGSAQLAQVADVMDDVIGNIQAAQQGAEAWGGWWGAIIGGVTDLIPKIFKWTSGDRELEKQIQKHAEAVAELERAYNALSWAIDKALGSDVYKRQSETISNMKEQQQHLLEMQYAELNKKDTDKNKVNEWKEQYAELGRQIEDMLDEIRNDILQTDAKSFADELGDALVNAFSKGEDAAEAFGKTADNIIRNAVLNQLKKNFLEKQLQAVLNDLEKSMGYMNHNGDFSFNGLTDAEIARFKEQIAKISEIFNQQLNEYTKIFEDMGAADTSLTGAVKGVTEETASLVAGQMNAIRINQMESTEILRQQLMQLSTIAQNTYFNRYLADIYMILRTLDSADPMRPVGHI